VKNKKEKKKKLEWKENNNQAIKNNLVSSNQVKTKVNDV
jgi:hypothetical protein